MESMKRTTAGIRGRYSTLANKWNSILVVVLRNSTPNFHLFEFPFVREKIASVSEFADFSILVFQVPREKCTTVMFLLFALIFGRKVAQSV